MLIFYLSSGSGSVIPALWIRSDYWIIGKYCQDMKTERAVPAVNFNACGLFRPSINFRTVLETQVSVSSLSVCTSPCFPEGVSVDTGLSCFLAQSSPQAVLHVNVDLMT